MAKSEEKYLPQIFFLCSIKVILSDNVFMFMFMHLADAFIQSDLQMKI